MGGGGQSGVMGGSKMHQIALSALEKWAGLDYFQRSTEYSKYVYKLVCRLTRK